jgi:hypothetical protein
VVFLPECAGASSRTNAGAAEHATGGAGCLRPREPQLGVGWLKARQTPPGPTATPRGTGGLRGDYGVWPCSSRGHDPTAAGVDCGRRQPRSLRRARRPTSPCRSRERVAGKRVPSAGGAESARPASAAAPGRMVRTTARPRLRGGGLWKQDEKRISLLPRPCGPGESMPRLLVRHRAGERRRLRGCAVDRLEPERKPAPTATWLATAGPRSAPAWTRGLGRPTQKRTPISRVRAIFGPRWRAAKPTPRW